MKKKDSERHVSPDVSPEEIAKKTIQHALEHFSIALYQYTLTQSLEGKNELQDRMGDYMETIQGSIREIQRSGVQKQSDRVHGDLERFRKDPSSENFTALQQDLSTLKEYWTL